MEDLLIQFGITAVLTAIKNPKKKATLKRALLKVYRAIEAAYADDPDFE